MADHLKISKTLTTALEEIYDQFDNILPLTHAVYVYEAAQRSLKEFIEDTRSTE